jgi:streptogrisin C
MRLKRLCLAAALAVVGAAISPFAADAAPTASGAQAQLPAEVLDALQRDLGLTTSELDARLANEAAAFEVAEGLERSLGGSFAGSWLAGDEGDLTVAVTDASKATRVRAAGATPRVVRHSQSALDRIQSKLNRLETSAPATVTGWYVDVNSNNVVVQSTQQGAAAAQRFVADAGVASDAVRVEVTDEQPRLLYDVRGGDAYYTPQYRCSIGFSVNGGYVTAGHCGGAGTSTWGYNQVSQGSFRASTFPGRDEAWVAVNSNWVPRPVVNNYRGGTVLVRGSQVAAIGASVCRSGSTTGWRCGRIQARNQTVRYPQGTVYGLTRTSACAEGGDSGGSFISGNQAQGMTSGGSGNCTFGGTTFFQPVNPTLQRYGLRLVVG